MAKKSSIEKSKNILSLVNSLSRKRVILKEEIYKKDISLAQRFESVCKLSSLPRNSSKTRVRNRCAETGKARAHLRMFGLSRVAMRQAAARGYLPGVVKSSW